MLRIIAAMRVVLALLAVIVFGCSSETPSASAPLRADGPWQAVPIPFDPTFAATAEAACGRTRPGLLPLLHDLRGMSTDIIVSASAVGSGYCIADPSSGGGLKATEDSTTDKIAPPLDPRIVAASIVTAGPDANGDPRGILIGRAGDAVGRVRIVLADGREVTATLARGWFAAWWPGDVGAVSLVADDLVGLPLGSSRPERLGPRTAAARTLGRVSRRSWLVVALARGGRGDRHGRRAASERDRGRRRPHRHAIVDAGRDPDADSDRDAHAVAHPDDLADPDPHRRTDPRRHLDAETDR